jgi:hypothetical protein
MKEGHQAPKACEKEFQLCGEFFPSTSHVTSLLLEPEGRKLGRSWVVELA